MKAYQEGILTPVAVNRKLVPVEGNWLPADWLPVTVNRHRLRARYARATGTPPPACRFCGDPPDAYPLPGDGNLPEGHCPTCWCRHGRAIPLDPLPGFPHPCRKEPSP